MARSLSRLSLCILVFAASTAAAQPIVIDGHFDPAEWSTASVYGFPINLPGGGTTSAKMFITNDRDNLYVAIRIQEPTISTSESFALSVDATRDGTIGAGDDAVVLNFGSQCVNTKSFHDDFYYVGGTCPAGVICSAADASAGGTTDGNGAVDNDGSFTTFELWHPLASADAAHDMLFRRGRETLRFSVLFRYTTPGPVVTDTDFPLGGLAGYVIHP